MLTFSFSIQVDDEELYLYLDPDPKDYYELSDIDKQKTAVHQRFRDGGCGCTRYVNGFDVNMLVSIKFIKSCRKISMPFFSLLKVLIYLE